MNTDTDNSWQGSVTDDQPQNGELFDWLDGISQNHHTACDVLERQRRQTLIIKGYKYDRS